MDDFRPCFAAIMRPINVRPHIVEAQRVHRGVSGVGVEVARVDDRNFLPGRNRGGVTSFQFFPPSVVR